MKTIVNEKIWKQKKQAKLKNGQLVAKATKNCNIFQSWIIANSQSARFLSIHDDKQELILDDDDEKCTYDMFAKNNRIFKSHGKKFKQATITFSDDDNDIILIWRLWRKKISGPSVTTEVKLC